jgi:hypothetical protein
MMHALQHHTHTHTHTHTQILKSRPPAWEAEYKAWVTLSQLQHQQLKQYPMFDAKQQQQQQQQQQKQREAAGAAPGGVQDAAAAGAGADEAARNAR